ncbi:MAG: ATP-dependent 6-phosphofructokinase [Anaerolineae bacterium]|nr:ATP-dependent 6-phosphofructokinase [Anaerolineae bacterium]
MGQAVRRIGVLTGGGDCPGLNAVIRAVVKTAINEYDWDVVGIEDGFEGLIQPGKVRPLTMQDVHGILPRGGTILGTTNRANPFRYEVKVGDALKVFDVSDDVVRHVEVLGIDAIVVIGGDGSLRITHELMQKGLVAVGVPKTIDNDIQKTSITFGFDTAVNTAMEALDKLHTTAESHHRALILEVMGRDAGWIALKAGIAGDADVILIPEIPFNIDVVLDKVKSRTRSGAKYSIIIVAEGAAPEGGAAVYQSYREIGAEQRLGGVGESLAAQLRARSDIEVRVTVLGHLQRGGSPSAFDRLLATRFGAMAVRLIAKGQLGHMVALDDEHIVAVPIAEAIARQKLVPLDSDMIQTAFGLDVCMGNTREFVRRLCRDQALDA